jgi:hypothetical protein
LLEILDAPFNDTPPLQAVDLEMGENKDEE